MKTVADELSVNTENGKEKKTEREWLEIMGARNRLFNTKESITIGRTFIPRPSDVFIDTYPKCGTTWVTQIAHTLRSRGHMDFEEITEVCPWDCQALDCGQDVNADQLFNPRIFKSHESYTYIAKNLANPPKYIVVFRHPHDAFVSFYHFLPNYFGVPPGELSIETYADAMFGGVSSFGHIWEHMMTWYEARQELGKHVLWMFYEDLQNDCETEIKRIAAFMEIELDPELLIMAKEKSTYQYMFAHRTQFDDHFVFEHNRKRMGMTSDSEFERIGKVRAGGGKVGSRSTIPEPVVALLEEKWRNVIQAKTGFRNYEEFMKFMKSL